MPNQPVLKQQDPSGLLEEEGKAACFLAPVAQLVRVEGKEGLATSFSLHS